MKAGIFLVLAALLVAVFALHKLDYLDFDANALRFRAASSASPGMYDACAKLGGRVEGPFLLKGKAGNPDYQCNASIPWAVAGIMALGLAVVVGFGLQVARRGP